jgi:hypothetical protein
MNIERLQMSIQTVKENIAILENQEPEDAGHYLQLEHEKMVLDALEKQMPKKPIINRRKIQCVNGHNQPIQHYKYCPMCGQLMDYTDHPTEKGGD